MGDTQSPIWQIKKIAKTMNRDNVRLGVRLCVLRVDLHDETQQPDVVWVNGVEYRPRNASPTETD
jgi:hypothetical protein